MAHEQLQQQELRARQLERTSRAARLVRERIELEVLEAQGLAVALPAGAAQQRTQSGDQLLAGERLDQVVIRAGLEARDPL